MRLAALFLLFLTALCDAANVYVRPTMDVTNDGDGTTWAAAASGGAAGARKGLPTTVRGNTYYVSDGSYTGPTLSTANSGTTTITIKKATVADHGGQSTGWVDTMGDGQAVFSFTSISTDYYIFDGQTRDTNWYTGAVSGYGIKITGGGSNGKALRLDVGTGVGADHCIFQYVDFVGGGRDTGDGDDVIYGLYDNTANTWRYCSLRDSDRTIFLMRDNWANTVVDQCYIARNASSPAIHGEMCSTTAGDDVTFSNNVIEDCEGTAIWAFLNNGTANRWLIYGNTIRHSPTYISDAREGISAVVYCANDGSNNNFLNSSKCYHNTIYGIRGVESGFHIEGGTGNLSSNNVWVSCVSASSSGITESYNYYATGVTNSDSGTGTLTGQSGSIFVSASTGDFHLTGHTTAGTDLGASFTPDRDGVARTATPDRGALQFGTSSGTIGSRRAGVGGSRFRFP